MPVAAKMALVAAGAGATVRIAGDELDRVRTGDAQTELHRTRDLFLLEDAALDDRGDLVALRQNSSLIVIWPCLPSLNRSGRP